MSKFPINLLYRRQATIPSIIYTTRSSFHKLRTMSEAYVFNTTPFSNSTLFRREITKIGDRDMHYYHRIFEHVDDTGFEEVENPFIMYNEVHVQEQCLEYREVMNKTSNIVLYYDDRRAIQIHPAAKGCSFYFMNEFKKRFLLLKCEEFNEEFSYENF